jgi:parvulin-like peptidyl-prolyl isomerase
VRQGDDYWVYKLVSKRASAVPSFEEARAEVERDLLLGQARDQLLADARQWLAQLRGGEKPDALAARLKGQSRTTALFTQRDFVSEAGMKGELFQEAFGLEPGACGGPVAAPDGRVVLYRVDARVPATREAFATEKDAVTARLRSARKDRLFEAWLEDLRRLRSVRINDALVGKL